jgi:hypothetical protein
VSRLRATVQPVASLDGFARGGMYLLFERYYDHVDPWTFYRDLARKRDVILLRDDEGYLRGFSTLQPMTVEVDGEPHRGVYSGDTVIEAGWRGNGALGRAFLRYLLREQLREPTRPLWWFLISKGYKTYLIMANNFPEHWPRYEQATPPLEAALSDAFARQMFGDAWNPADGVVRFGPDAPRLKAGVAPIEPELLVRSPRVRFFQERDPGWMQGDELVCLARMTPWMPAWYTYKKLFCRPGATG